MVQINSPLQGFTRIRVFIDFWNFQLSLNERHDQETGAKDSRIQIDWHNVGERLATKAAAVAKCEKYSYEGTILYTSYNTKKPEDRKFKGWITNLDLAAGVNVVCLERQPKGSPKCPACHQIIAECPHCQGKTLGTVEKGVDTLMVTDMIRLAWEQAYEVAVVASADRDLAPAVEFLNAKGRRVINAAVFPFGRHLSKKCWASFDVYQMLSEITRTKSS